MKHKAFLAKHRLTFVELCRLRLVLRMRLRRNIGRTGARTGARMSYYARPLRLDRLRDTTDSPVGSDVRRAKCSGLSLGFISQRPFVMMSHGIN